MRATLVAVAVVVATLAGCGSGDTNTAKAVCDEIDAVIAERPEPSEARRRVRAALEDAVDSGDQVLADAAEEVLAEWTDPDNPPGMFAVTLRCAEL